MLQYFFDEFRKEHRIIRDLLLNLITSFIQKDMEQSGQLLLELDKIAGPHFKYEEESLYPALVTIFGEPYINKLLTDHDLAIARAIKLKTLIGKSKHTENDYLEGINLVRAILPHVSDCEGLTIMVERLPAEVVNSIVETMKAAHKQNTPLLSWAGTERNRKLLEIS